MDKTDFVITWVDSNDKEWQLKKAKYAKSEDNQVEDFSNERYRDYGTLKFLLRSIEKYASWIHKVYLITDSQIPDWLNTANDRLVVVDHKEIIPNHYLPTFNSNSIELNIDNISGLSEQFVVFNDDLIINNIVEETDFFKKGLPRDYRIYTSLLPNSRFDRIIFNDSLAINQWLKGNWISKQGLFSLKYGKLNFKNVPAVIKKKHRISHYVMPHNALSFRKDSYKKAKDIWRLMVKNTELHRFRHDEDISIWLIRYFQLEMGEFIPRSPKFSQYYTLNNYKQVAQDLHNKEHKLICINDAETSEYEDKSRYLIKALKKEFPNKSIFEK